MYHNIIVICCSLLIISCSSDDSSSTSTTKAAPTNSAPIYLTSISTSLTTSEYDTKFKEGIDAGISYFGSIAGVYIYIYDQNGVETVAKDFCEKQVSYTSTTSYDECYAHQLSASSANGLKSSVESSNTSNAFNAALNGSTNGFYPMSFGLSDSPTDNATYLAHIAIHEYAHVYQHHYSVADTLAYSTWVTEGYAQFIGQLIGSQKSYTNFASDMLSSFSTIRDMTETSLMFSAQPYQTGSWAMAYLAQKVNTANSCTSNCSIGLNALKTFFETAGVSGAVVDTVFESTFGLTQSALETELSAFLLAMDYSSGSSTEASAWLSTFYNSQPTSL